MVKRRQLQWCNGQKAAIAMVQWSKGGNGAMVQWSKGGNCNGAMVKWRQLCKRSNCRLSSVRARASPRQRRRLGPSGEPARPGLSGRHEGVVVRAVEDHPAAPRAAPPRTLRMLVSRRAGVQEPEDGGTPVPAACVAWDGVVMLVHANFPMIRSQRTPAVGPARRSTQQGGGGWGRAFDIRWIVCNGLYYTRYASSWFDARTR
jgi:hypothetical protein